MARSDLFNWDATRDLDIFDREVTASQLVDMDIPEPTWLVPSLLPEGVTLLCGKPKVGKSYMALNIAVNLAKGNEVLGKIDVAPAGVLYLALEDNLRRLRNRILEMLFTDSPPENLHLVTTWFKADMGGLEDLNYWLDMHTDVKLVIVDTLERFRPVGRRRDKMYSEDYAAIEGLKKIADERSIAILVVHHLRKAESEDPLDLISGSTGLSGAADGVMILKRERGNADAFLFITGRDIEETEVALEFDTTYMRWEIIGAADEYKVSKARREIMEYLTEVGEPQRPKEIAEALGKSPSTTRVLLSKMLKDAQVIQPEDGKYSINSINTLNTVSI